MAKLTILDGGMGVELQRRGLARTGLWSAAALIDHPDVVAEVHSDYIKAGAMVITTNTYSTIPSYLGKEGQGDRYLELAEIAGQIARQAAAAASSEVLVAGSLPPLEESYRFDRVMEDEVCTPVYKALATTLQPYVDLFLCETMSCGREARTAASAARSVVGTSKPVWVSWTLADEPGAGLRSGESIADAYQMVAELSPDAFLFNCTEPEAITVALRTLRELTDKPIGGYPNRFHVPRDWTLDNEIDVEPRPMSEQEFLAYVRQWQSLGASIAGGCCGVGPEFIEAISLASE